MLKYEFRCEICQAKFDSDYNIPKVLICGHTVCSKCVERMKEKDILRCPFDRKLIDYDEDKIAINYYILSLIDGSIKENPVLVSEDIEEEFALSPKPVINNPGWKNTLDGFIRGEILYTIESNGFFYCTDLNTGEWWFLYLNQFWGRHYFDVPGTNKMFMIDHVGNLYQIFTKNYYVQIGKKNSWRNTTHVCVLNGILYSIETSNKLYETNLETGKWKEVGARKWKDVSDDDSESSSSDGNESDGFAEGERVGETDNTTNTITNTITNTDTTSNTNQNFTNSNSSNNNLSRNNNFNHNLINFNIAGINIRIPNILSFKQSNSEIKKTYEIPPEPIYRIKDAIMMISSGENILISNKKGEVYLLNEITGETTLLNSCFSKNVEAYSNNSTHIYYFEKGGNTIYRTKLGKEEMKQLFIPMSDKSNNFYPSNSNSNNNNNNTPTLNNTSNDNDSSQNKYVNFKSLLNNETPINGKEFYQKLEENKKRENSVYSSNSFNTMRKISSNSYSSRSNSNSIVTDSNSNQKIPLNSEIFIELGDISPIKVFVDDQRLVITDKKGELLVYDIKTLEKKNYQCLFMLRNCHLQNTILVGDGDLLILDPIRLSMNKLNILSGSEMIILHSIKFLSTIKHVFSCGTKIYFIDISGSLFQFLESEKKIAQIGNNGICRYLLDFAVHKNFLYTVENTTLYRTNLHDGNFVEVKNDYTFNYKFFFADNVYLVFVSKEDEICVVKPEESLKLKKKIKINNISKMESVSYFKNHLVFYNVYKKTIETVNLEIGKNEEVEERPRKVMVENFPEVSLFINNHDCLACITKDGVIYKLHC